MKNKKTIILTLLVMLFSTSLMAKKYYLNSVTGNDSNDGLSENQALKTLEQASKITLNGNDILLIAGGQTFEGTLKLKNCYGSTNSKIKVTTYGNGSCTINSGNNAGVILNSCSNLIIENIVIIGSGRLNGNTSNGISLKNCSNCHVDKIDVSGYLHSGLHVESCNDLKITNCSTHDNGFCGLFLMNTKIWSHNVYIGYCKADNNPGCPTNKTNHSGNGIFVSGVTNCLVEYCEASNNGWDMPRPGNGPVGIWAADADSVVIQYCIAHHNKTSPTGNDGGGFDLDGGVTNSILQYNYSYLNEGAGYGLFQYIHAIDWNNNIVRYNISVDDGSKNGKCGILFWSDKDNKVNNMSDVWIYNNTIINSFGHAVNYQDNTPTNCHLMNNIFISKLAPIAGNYSQSTYSNNLYWMYEAGKFQVEKYTSLEEWSKATGQEKNGGIVKDPLLVGPINYIEEITDPTKLTSLTAYKLKNNPCVGASKPVKENGGKDLWGNKLPENGKTDIGACQTGN